MGRRRLAEYVAPGSFGEVKVPFVSESVQKWEPSGVTVVSSDVPDCLGAFGSGAERLPWRTASRDSSAALTTLRHARQSRLPDANVLEKLTATTAGAVDD
ncbi:hypothetical protein GCM10027436_13760 [Actinophytocola sediminis]